MYANCCQLFKKTSRSRSKQAAIKGWILTDKLCGYLCHSPAISTVFPINRILYFISIGSILNKKSLIYKPFQSF